MIIAVLHSSEFLVSNVKVMRIESQVLDKDIIQELNYLSRRSNSITTFFVKWWRIWLINQCNLIDIFQFRLVERRRKNATLWCEWLNDYCMEIWWCRSSRDSVTTKKNVFGFLLYENSRTSLLRNAWCKGAIKKWLLKWKFRASRS